MLAGMSSRQMAEWRAFWQVEPFGVFRDDWRFACLLAMLANMFRDGKNSPPVGPQEFMSLLDPTEETETPKAAEQASEQFESMWAKMLGYEE